MVTPPRAPRILLAEDDDAMRTLLASGLRRRGYDVRTVASGSALVEHLLDGSGPRDDLPDLLVSDVRMPGSSGLAVLRAVRARAWATPVLLITAFGDASLHDEAERMGALVLDKPFDLDELYRLVGSALSP